MLDSKTHWNSAAQMIRCLWEIFPAVKKALQEFGLENLIPTSEEEILL